MRTLCLCAAALAITPFVAHAQSASGSDAGAQIVVTGSRTGGDGSTFVADAATIGRRASASLLDTLDDASWRVRRAAAHSLARRADTEIVAALVRTMRADHRKPGLLNSALQALALLGADAVDPLIDVLDTPDTDLRIYVVLALGEQHDRRVAPALIHALHDPFMRSTRWATYRHPRRPTRWPSWPSRAISFWHFPRWRRWRALANRASRRAFCRCLTTSCCASRRPAR